MQDNPLQHHLPVVVPLWSDGASTAPADPLWTDRYTPHFDNGFVSLTLENHGTEQPQAQWFVDEVWLEMRVDGSRIGPRTRIVDSGRSAATASANGQILSGPGAAFDLVEHPTKWAATTSTYNGNISYSGALGTLYEDCDHFTTTTSSRRIQRYSAISSAAPYGTVATSGCNSSFLILCCQ